MEDSRKELVQMLQSRRRAGTKGEAEFVAQYIASVDGMHVDDYGNFYIVVGEGSKTIFSCHTDSVHVGDTKYCPQTKVMIPVEGGAKLTQQIMVDEHYTRCWRPEEATDCLGADDAVGIWMMLNMIREGVAGLYIFHRDEEIGGLGSEYIRDNDAWNKIFLHYDRAVAFDRWGTQDVITFQGTRCCSDGFANALSSQLNGLKFGFDYRADDGGVFTDTAQYTGLIPECTNISCGYYNEHTQREYVDLGHAQKLLEACVAVSWETLPTIRNVDDIDEYSSYWGNYRDPVGADDGWADTDTTGPKSMPAAATKICCMSQEKVTAMLEQWGIDLMDVNEFEAGYKAR